MPQLETTVTKLQTALGFSPEQVAALPPPLLKIRELEQDNTRLQKENEELRRMLADTGSRASADILRRGSLGGFHDVRNCDRELKRRKMSGNVEEVYMVRTLFPRTFLWSMVSRKTDAIFFPFSRVLLTLPHTTPYAHHL